jgi:hypothetical protein
LALNGLILPKEDPFWLTHTGPWDWGCTCYTRPINPDFVADEKAADEKRNPEDRLVVEGPALRKLNEGTLIRGGRAYDVAPPEGSGAFRFNPADLRISLDDIKARYDPEVFAQFELLAKATILDSGQTLWEWLTGGETPQDVTTQNT